MRYDIYLVGVGGQGIITIGELLASTAEACGMPVNFFPSKGMAQRGGFVKAQLRLGREPVGPNIPEASADLVIAMELSEALKAVRYIRKDGDFLLLGDVWSPTAVMLGKAAYPDLNQVCLSVLAARARWLYVSPKDLPVYHEEPVAPNVFLLGVALAITTLKQVFTPEQISEAIQQRWKRAGDANRFAFEAGLNYAPQLKTALESR